MLQEYIYIYKYSKAENEELSQIVQESKAAVNDLKAELQNNENNIDNDVMAKYEKSFIKKLQIWRKKEIKERSFEIQKID